MVIYSAPRCYILKVLIQLFILIANAQQPELWWTNCPNTSTYSQNSTYQANLRRVLSDLSSNNATNSLFSNVTIGINAPDVVYGLVLCRGDITSDACRECVKIATSEIITNCPIEKEAYIWYDQCMLRYNNISFFDRMDTYPGIYVFNTQNVSNPDRFDHVLGDAMNVLINRASGTGTFSPVKAFATGEANFTSIIKLFNLVQCTPNLSSSQCNQCLRSAINNRAYGSPSWRSIYPSCIIRYETYLFYNNNVASPAPPPSPTPFLLPPPPPPFQVPDIDSKGNSGLSVVVVAIVLPIIVFVALLGVIFRFLIRKAMNIQHVMIDKTDATEGNDNSAPESLQYDLTTIKAATNNFSAENKIGEGGFGQVFKGNLNGNQIAVKRLSKNSEQGQQEFKNEVLLVAKLEHKNLVRVLGYCLDEGEKILIYEFVPNKSLDFILFDQEKRQSLDWSRRYKIIEGVAKGILYLHEDSRLRIIHRDLKASNVLLDNDMNAKIADFGLSRIVGVDESKVKSRRIVGTFGYMPPEYMHGQFSVKSDVFSFGVLVLEIISGKKNNGFYQSSDHLLSHAWTLWRDRRPLEFVDPVMGQTFARNEVIRCMHMGLLCVQKDPDKRPTMGSVVIMLGSYSVTLPLPHHPAFFLPSKTKTRANQSHSYKSTSKSLPLSVNEVSVTELYPR